MSDLHAVGLGLDPEIIQGFDLNPSPSIEIGTDTLKAFVMCAFKNDLHKDLLRDRLFRAHVTLFHFKNQDCCAQLYQF